MKNLMEDLYQENLVLLQENRDLQARNASLTLLAEKQGKELEEYETAICIKVSKWSFAVFMLIVIAFVIAYLFL